MSDITTVYVDSSVNRLVNQCVMVCQCVFLWWFVQINRDSTNYIVEEYKRLRQRDQTGAARSAWRITVRQLESMIRLSEAIARMYCQDEVCHYFTAGAKYRYRN